jgi:phage host-nuclease inhibitor protein Gam
MSKNRIKKSLTPAVQSRADAETRMFHLAEAANERQALIAEMDEQLLAIKKEYEADIGQLELRIGEATADLEAWALAHPEEFGKRKSIEFLSGVLGFRTGTPKLALLNRSWKWETVTAAVERMLPNFIRSHTEVDKQAILGQRDELAEFLPGVGLRVVQDDGFYIEPKLTQKEVAS